MSSTEEVAAKPGVALRPEDIQLLIAVIKQVQGQGINLQEAADEMAITKNAITKRWKALRIKLFGDAAIGAPTAGGAKAKTPAGPKRAAKAASSATPTPKAKKAAATPKRKRAKVESEVESGGEQHMELESENEANAEVNSEEESLET